MLNVLVKFKKKNLFFKKISLSISDGMNIFSLVSNYCRKQIELITIVREFRMLMMISKTIEF